MSRIHFTWRATGLALAFLTLAAAPLAAQTTINQFSLGADLQPLDIAAGPNGNLWFTVNGDGSAGTSKVGRITIAGTITEIVLPDTSRPIGIVAGPTGRYGSRNQAPAQSHRSGESTRRRSRRASP